MYFKSIACHIQLYRQSTNKCAFLTPHPLTKTIEHQSNRRNNSLCFPNKYTTCGLSLTIRGFWRISSPPDTCICSNTLWIHVNTMWPVELMHFSAYSSDEAHPVKPFFCKCFHVGQWPDLTLARCASRPNQSPRRPLWMQDTQAARNNALETGTKAHTHSSPQKRRWRGEWAVLLAERGKCNII